MEAGQGFYRCSNTGDNNLDNKDNNQVRQVCVDGWVSVVCAVDWVSVDGWVCADDWILWKFFVLTFLGVFLSRKIHLCEMNQLNRSSTSASVMFDVTMNGSGKLMGRL